MKQTNLHCSCNICIFIANVGTCWVINIWIVDVHLDLLHDVFEHKNSNKIVVHNQSPCLATIGMFIDNSQELTCQIKKMRTLIDFTQWLTNIFFLGGVAREKQFVWTLVDISQCLKSRCGMPKSFFSFANVVSTASLCGILGFVIWASSGLKQILVTRIKPKTIWLFSCLLIDSVAYNRPLPVPSKPCAQSKCPADVYAV